MNRLHDVKARTIYLLLLAPLLVYLFCILVPLCLSLYYSFFNWKGGASMRFVGFANYRRLLADPGFWVSFKNNLIVVAMCLLGNTFLGYLLALVLSSQYLRLAKLYKFVIFLPVILSGVVVGVLWKLIYNDNPGLLNLLLELVGLGRFAKLWLGDSKIVIYSICVIRIWKSMGMHLILYLAGLQNIPPDVLEAAAIDGAAGARRCWYVVTPMMAGTICVSTLFTITDSLKIFELIFTTTKGGPGISSSVMAYLSYRQAFEYYKISYSSATALASLVLGTALVVAVNTLIKGAAKRYGA